MDQETLLPGQRGLFDRPTYRPQVDVQFSFEKFDIRSARTSEEISQLEELRKFHLRSESSLRSPMGLYLDETDFRSDHLIILRKGTKKLIGAVKIITGLNEIPYESKRIFKLDDLSQYKGSKIELSQMAFTKDLGIKEIMPSLIKVTARYAELIQADIIFGSAAFHQIDTTDVAKLYRYLAHQKKLSKWFFALPENAYRIAALYQALRTLSPSASFSDEDARSLTPYKLHFFLERGASVCSEPAFDPLYNSFRFLIAMKTSTLKAHLLNESLSTKPEGTDSF